MSAPDPSGGSVPAPPTSVPAPSNTVPAPSNTKASKADIRQWRRYLADEHAEASVYRRLARKRTGEEQEILFALAEAEGRHAAHWAELLGDQVGAPLRASWRTRSLAFLARHFGSVFVLALAQRAESRSPYEEDANATSAMAADERIHGEVVRGLAARGRARLSGTFRAAVFGANDGLVSNLALILGIGASGASARAVLVAGLAGLLAGALSMGAGEYISVRSQRELLEASAPDPHTRTIVSHLDVNANELTLVYRARGMDPAEAAERAARMIEGLHTELPPIEGAEPDEHEEIGTAMRAAVSSFCFFASGALIPVLPYLFGATGRTAQLIAAGLVGIALLLTGAIVGLLSGGAPLRRALRQLGIGFGAAAVTYGLGLLFNV